MTASLDRCDAQRAARRAASAQTKAGAKSIHEEVRDPLFEKSGETSSSAMALELSHRKKASADASGVKTLAKAKQGGAAVQSATVASSLHADARLHSFVIGSHPRIHR